MTTKTVATIFQSSHASTVQAGDLRCPRCGFDYTHINSVTVGSSSGQKVTLHAGGEDEHGNVTVEHGTGSFGTRRHTIILHGSCENGCEFEFELLQHKGATYVGVESGPGQVERAITELGKLCSLCESPPEIAFWQEWLRQAQQFEDTSASGLRPQVTVGKYRLDFANPDVRFGVEIDGLAYHNGQDSFVRDRSRQRALEADGWKIIRFAAVEVLRAPDQCVDETQIALRATQATA